MNIFTLNSREFKKLEKYSLNRIITNTESQLFIVDRKIKWNHEKQLLKQFYKTSTEYFSNKLYTVNTLIDNRSFLEMDELVLPTDLFALDNKIEGYTMPFIEHNINLSVLLNSPGVSLKNKINMLKRVGTLLQKVSDIKGMNQSFFLGDIHESNFIFDTEKKIFRAVDLDSCKIGKNNASISRYLTFNSNLWEYPRKYPLDEDDIHISNENTTILSFIYIILNTISGINISKLSIADYYNYLQYLLDHGFNSDVIDDLARIYTKGDNKLDLELLDSIPTDKKHILTYQEFKK